jgi:hypothetical protein
MKNISRLRLEGQNNHNIDPTDILNTVNQLELPSGVLTLKLRVLVKV